MTDYLTQAEADQLLAASKLRIGKTPYPYPAAGGSVVVPLIAADGREEFLLDVRRNMVNLAKGTYQNRTRTAIILARLDFGGAPHRNPDDVEIDCPHIHLYREGFGDKWALPIDPNVFSNIADPWESLLHFMKFINVIDPPEFDRGLFP